MKNGLTDQQRAELVAEQTLAFVAILDPVELGAFIGAVIAAGSAIADETPLDWLETLKSQVPGDVEWVMDGMGERTKTKVSNAAKIYSGAVIRFAQRRPQG